MTVLLADDSALVRSNLAQLIRLSRSEITLRESGDVESTIRELHGGDIDVLVLDLYFPDGSGFAVLRNIEKEFTDTESCGKPYIIVLSNHARDYVRKKSLQMGAHQFFDKSSEYERVVDVISRL